MLYIKGRNWWLDGGVSGIFPGCYLVDFAVSIQKYQLRGISKNIQYLVVFSTGRHYILCFEKISLKYIFHGYFDPFCKVVDCTFIFQVLLLCHRWRS